MTLLPALLRRCPVSKSPGWIPIALLVVVLGCGLPPAALAQDIVEAAAPGPERQEQQRPQEQEEEQGQQEQEQQQEEERPVVVETVIVTAQKRLQDPQDVPLSITTIGADEVC